MGRKKSGENEDEKVELECDEMLLESFIERYMPCEQLSLATDVFYMNDVRQFFSAYPSSNGDLLPMYIHRLKEIGYVVRPNWDGKLCMPLKWRD